MMVMTVQGVDNIALIIIIAITFMKKNNKTTIKDILSLFSLAGKTSSIMFEYGTLEDVVPL